MSSSTGTEDISDGRPNRFRNLFESEVLRDIVTIRETDKEKTSGELTVTSVDLNIRSNVEPHHTEKFDITNALLYDSTELLVVRRGQPFDMKIQFNRTFDQAKDDVSIIFEFGFNPLPSKGSRVCLSLKDKGLPENQWKTVINSNKDNWLNISVTPSPDCAISAWNLKINNKFGEVIEEYKHEDPVYILFNPWNKDDQVYMESGLDEYVLNEDGEIYCGTYEDIGARKWVFGQFSGEVLQCCMYLLDQKSRLWDFERGDPVKVSRAISSFVNSSENFGVLTGKWAGEEEAYKPYKFPWSWTGSVAILREYFQEKRPVRYGQCWVFSGVVTTVCRALGIPTRSVTNFASAHDTDGSVTIDTYYAHDGREFREIKSLSGDSVWNFHVWNDVWMKRPDLKGDYDGWQAIDATPQELSGNTHCMGPMSLKAIKQGELHCQYDGPFAFSEVNADKLTWLADKSGNARLYYAESDSIGLKISTKIPIGQKPNVDDWKTPWRMDITHLYKHGEDSKEERDAVREAVRSSTRKFYYKEKQEWKVEFSLKIQKEDILIGDPIDFSLMIKSLEDEYRMITGIVKVACTDYTGKEEKVVKYSRLSQEERNLQGHGENKMDYNLSVDDYLFSLMDGDFIRVSSICEVEATGQIFTDIQTIILRRPKLVLKAPKKGTLKETFSVEASFENPLDMKLTDCEVEVEGPGLQSTKIFPQSDVEAKARFTFKCDFTPQKAGNIMILLQFNSKQLHSVEGSEFIEISKGITGTPMETE